jgi:hypothetical protein
MASGAELNMMRQQGFLTADQESCDFNVAGTLFQPRIVFPLVLLATLLDSPRLFLGITGVLAWNALLPRWNPFERAYNGLFARPFGRPPVPPAPAPRRFAQAMAAAFTAGAALSSYAGAVLAACVFEAALVVAFGALLFGRFCLGAYVYHVLHGRHRFANATLPWARARSLGIRPRS